MSALEVAGRALAAEFIVAVGLCVAFAVTARLVRRTHPALRWTATAIVGMALASFAFHLFATLGQFTLPGIVALMLTAGLIARAAGPPPAYLLAVARRDGRWARRSARLLIIRRSAWLGKLLVAFFLLTSLRVLLLPPLGWDGLTYHGVKAAAWVGGGGWETPDYPGAWRLQRLYPGGGEVFTAWAMSPFHSDLLAAIPEILFWFLLGLCVFALGRSLGLRAVHAWTAAAYSMCLPCVAMAVGSLYVDTALAVACLSALAFLLGRRSARGKDANLVLRAFLALGLAAAIKILAWPFALLVGGVALAGRRGSRRAPGRAPLLTLLAGSLLALLLASPWLYRVHLLTGYPLSPFDVEVAGVRLGEANPLRQQIFRGPDPQPYALASEVSAAWDLFRPQLRTRANFGLFTLLPVLISVAGGLALARRHRPALLLLLGAAVSFVVVYLSPGFTDMRLNRGASNARFLLPPVCILVLLSFSWCGSGRRRLSRAYTTAMGLGCVGLMASMLWNVPIDFAPIEFTAVPTALAAVLGAALILLVARRVSRSAAVVWVGALAMPLVLVPGLAAYKRATRYEVAFEARALHRTPATWQEAARAMDTPGRPRRIALVGSERQGEQAWVEREPSLFEKVALPQPSESTGDPRRQAPQVSCYRVSN